MAVELWQVPPFDIAPSGIEGAVRFLCLEHTFESGMEKTNMNDPKTGVFHNAI